ncbi:MAG: 16S rRNA (adenine(1518)-N(6)/adenine(1519)-N(6))-dimethyltransferase RsmA [Pseudomonadota bacterium]
MIRPKKRLGQHFLKDRGIIHDILSLSRLDRSDQVIEIGAGLGSLTIPLAGLVQQIYAVEKDPQLVEILREKLSGEGIQNVTVIQEDILRLDFEKMLPISAGKIKVMGNLPYNISSPVLEKLVKNRDRVGKAILMFQLEFARRLISPPGSKVYGAISVLIRYHAHPSPLLEVSKEAFYPKPKVNSMVLELDFQRPYPRRAKDEDHFKRIVKGAFAQRRKTLLNALKSALPSYEEPAIRAALRQSDIDPRRRAETLDMDGFLHLTDALSYLDKKFV